MIGSFVRASVLMLIGGAPLLAASPSIHVKGGSIDFKVGDALVARYHIAKSVAKPYFWPVHAPTGVAVTRAWPMIKKAEAGERKDHVHQKSAWFCHGDVIPEGMDLKNKIRGVDGVDFWSERAGAGKIVCVKVEKPVIKERRASVTTMNEWRTSSGKKILDEKRVIHLESVADGYLLTLEIDLCASVVPITFGDTKEGSMGVRVRHCMIEKEGGKLESAEGKVGANNLWGRHSVWNDYSGTIPGKKAGQSIVAGIAIFDDPNNSPKAAWHSRNYGLMAANPFGRARSRFPAVKNSKDLKKLKKGEHLRLRYGLFTHLGDAKKGKVAAAFEQFSK